MPDDIGVEIPAREGHPRQENYLETKLHLPLPALRISSCSFRHICVKNDRHGQFHISDFTFLFGSFSRCTLQHISSRDDESGACYSNSN